MQHIHKPTWSGLSTQGTLQVRRSVEQSSIACRVVISSHVLHHSKSSQARRNREL